MTYESSIKYKNILYRTGTILLPVDTGNYSYSDSATSKITKSYDWTYLDSIPSSSGGSSGWMANDDFMKNIENEVANANRGFMKIEENHLNGFFPKITNVKGSITYKDPLLQNGYFSYSFSSQ